MSHRSIPYDFVKSVLNNGVGRYVCQLQRITFKFCKSHGGSKGVRDFIENDLLDFTRSNPGIVVYLHPRRHRAPKLVAEYLNGNTQEMYVNTLPKEEIGQWLNHFRTRSGVDIVRLNKTWHTDSPSIQGNWTPFTNKDPALNVTEFPCEELSKFKPTEKTATEILLERAKQLREESKELK